MPPLGKRKNLLIPEPPDNASEKSTIGNRKSEMSLAERTTQDVLLHFGETVKVAWRRYRDFACAVKSTSCVSTQDKGNPWRRRLLPEEKMRLPYFTGIEKGIAQGTRPELQGGGLVRPACHARCMGILKNDKVDREYSTSKRQPGVRARASRSAGGDKRGLLGRKKEERPACLALRSIAGREKGDERILGSGDFVNEALRKAGQEWEKRKKKRMPLEQLIGEVASHFDLKEASIISASRTREISEARGIICCLAVKELGYSAAEVANALDLRRVSAGQCVVRGEKILEKDPDLRDKLSIN